MGTLAGTDLISKKTRQVFREYLVSWTLRKIANEFDAADVECNLEFHPTEVSGERRKLVEQYYHTINWKDWSDVKKIILVFAEIISSAKEEEKFSNFDVDKTATDIICLAIMRMLNALKKDGFYWIDGKIVRGSGLPLLPDIKETAAVFDTSYMTDQINRMEQAIEPTPDVAIGTAKELIETCCKTILMERGKGVEGTPDIPTLTKMTLKELKLVPDGIPEQARGSEVIKRLLQNLGVIGNGLAELRGLYGTGHGKPANTKGLSPRHAKLAVGVASTLAVFLFETHMETMPPKP